MMHDETIDEAEGSGRGRLRQLLIDLSALALGGVLALVFLVTLFIWGISTGMGRGGDEEESKTPKSPKTHKSDRERR